MNILIIPVFLALMYVALLRPQQKRIRRQQALLTSIGVGDEIVTGGGLIGRVVSLTDDRMQLEVAPGVVVELLRLAVSRRLEPADGGDVTPALDDFGAEPGGLPTGSASEDSASMDQQAHLPPEQDSH